MFELNDVDLIVSSGFVGCVTSGKVIDLTIKAAESVNNKILKCVVMGIGAGTAVGVYIKTFAVTHQILSMVKDKIYH